MPVFFLLGLLGVVICHVLKRKGYRCTTEPQDGEEETWDGPKDPELGEGEERFSCILSEIRGQPPSPELKAGSLASLMANRPILWRTLAASAEDSGPLCDEPQVFFLCFYCICGDIV